MSIFTTKHLLLGILFLLSFHQTHAQRGVFIGAFGGYNNIWIINSNAIDGGLAIDYEPTFGPNFGAALGWNFHDKMGIHIEASFSYLGQDYTGLYKTESGIYSSNKLDYYDSKQRINYLSIPILFKYKGGESEGQGMGILVGPQFSFLQSATLSRVNSKDFDKAAMVKNFDSTNTQYFNDMDISVYLGLGSFNQFNEYVSMLINFRFNYSFTDLINSDHQSTYHPAGELDPQDPNNPSSKPVAYGNKSYKPSNNASAGIELHFYFHVPY